MEKSEAAHEQAGLRRKKSLTCPTCGTVFEGLAQGVYCSPRCRWLAWNGRKVVEESRRLDLADKEVTPACEVGKHGGS
jgi:hypothetical protein